MSPMEYVGVAALVAAAALVGLGWAAFWRPYPPIDDTPMPAWATQDPVEPERPRRYKGKARGQERLDGAEVPLPAPRQDLTGENPVVVLQEEEHGTARWTTNTAGQIVIPVPVERPLTKRPMHRWEHVGEGTQPLHWPEQ